MPEDHDFTAGGEQVDLDNHSRVVGVEAHRLKHEEDENGRIDKNSKPAALLKTVELIERVCSEGEKAKSGS